MLGRRGEPVPPRMVVADLGDLDASGCESAAAALEQITPVAEALRPGLHAFAARGPSRYFGGEQALADLVATTAAETVPSATRIGVGVADGLFCAGLAARTSTVAEGAGGAGGAAVVVARAHGRRFLAGLPLASLADPVSPLHPDSDGTEALLKILWNLGMRTLGDLAALREADMLGRFGRRGLQAHRLACGFDERTQPALAPAEDRAVQAEIEPPADRVETVAFIAKALADEMVDRLARNGLDCVGVSIEACDDSGHTSVRRWRHELRFDAPAVVDRVRWQLEGRQRCGPVTRLRITPTAVVAADGRQLAIWGERSDADVRARRALARVQGLLGDEAVTVPCLSGGRRPADIGRRVPLDSMQRKRHLADSDPEPVCGVDCITIAKSNAPAWPGRLPAPQPAVVLDEPEPVTVTDPVGAPVTVSGRGEPSSPPHQLTDSTGHSHRVVAWAGPWPLDERWWRPAARRRQARFQLVLEDGSAHLCVLEAGRWQRESTYE